jgi:hypothetical protein
MGIENSDSLKSPPVGTSKIPDVLKPWSSYSPADYTMDQHHNASLIHNHDGPPTSKDQCKLPIKTPSGMVHPGGVMAAAASLGGVKASADQKATAAKMLITHYKKMNTDPPPALKKLAHAIDVADFLEHHGTKGQKWGIRNARARITSGKTLKSDAKKLSDEEINKRIKRMELEKKYTDLSKAANSPGKKYVQDILHNSGKAIVGTAVGVGASFLVGKALRTKFG